MAPDKDPQLERLNSQLRDHGCPPERDLWQGIDAAITAEEKRLLGQPEKRSGSFWRPQVLWVAAAMAAFALVLIPLDFQPGGNDQIAGTNQPEIETEMALASSGNTLTCAMKSLEKAARENPGDQYLLRLVRMVNSRKGELLRHKWAGNTRVQGMLNGGVL